MIESRSLIHTDSISLRDVRCRPRDARCGREEIIAGHRIVLTRRGAFLNHVAGERVLSDPNHVLFINAGVPYRVSHPVAGGDDCTAIGVAQPLLLEILGDFDPAVADHPDTPFRRRQAPIAGSLVLAHLRLYHGVDRGRCDPLQAEDRILHLVACLLEAALPRAGRLTPHRPATERRHAETVEAARVYLAGLVDRSVSLAEISRRVCSSPYHLSRLFRSHVGIPIHRYHLWLRLNRAAERIAEGSEDLTRLALELGFSGHAHLTTSFVQAFGVAPSRFRKQASARRLAKSRKNLEARFESGR